MLLHQDGNIERFAMACEAVQEGNIPPRIGLAGMEAELRTRYVLNTVFLSFLRRRRFVLRFHGQSGFCQNSNSKKEYTPISFLSWFLLIGVPKLYILTQLIFNSSKVISIID